MFLALLQFDSFDRLASAALASGALISAVVGFAARDSLGNAIAGVALAVSQPIRVGDVVTIGDDARHRRGRDAHARRGCARRTARG